MTGISRRIESDAGMRLGVQNGNISMTANGIPDWIDYCSAKTRAPENVYVQDAAATRKLKTGSLGPVYRNVAVRQTRVMMCGESIIL